MFEKLENGLNEHYYVIPKRIKKQTYSASAKEDSITFKKIMEGFEKMNELYNSQFK